MAVPGASLFGAMFVGHSYPITDANFSRVDATHWVLDVCTSVTPSYPDLKEVCLFLLQPASLDPSAALGLYVRCAGAGPGGSDWSYRGCVHNGHPSEVMPLQWPTNEDGSLVAPGPGVVQIGVSIEPGADIINKEGSKLGAREDYAKRVAADLFRFLESFQTQQMGDYVVVPANALDKWFTRFQEKFRRDPDFLTRRRETF